MKPSDLRRDAYTWQAIASRAEGKASQLSTGQEALASVASMGFRLAARNLREAVRAMNDAADLLEVRDAS